IGNRRVRNGIQNLKIMSTKEESMNKGKNQNKLRENASIVINYTMESVGLKGSQNAMVAIDLGTTLRTVIKQTRLEKVANISNQLTEPATMFYACHSATIGKNMNMWYVDSACSNHMTSHESLLVNIDKNVKCRVKMGTGDLVQSTCKGTLVIEMQGVTIYIKEVMIVPGLDENLLSVGQM
ncbi:PREDICTED: Retrovirus-related Pol poly from transposon, partial [Prunus dulcis]